MRYGAVADWASSREAVIQHLADASVHGNLGFFLGAGFSKAVLDEPFMERASSWGELMKNAANDLKLEIDGLYAEGLSYPAFASRICRKLAKSRTIAFEEACLEYKKAISRITAWYPEKTVRDLFGPLITRISPTWVITTNYDLAFESLLPGKAISLGPSDIPVARRCSRAGWLMAIRPGSVMGIARGERGLSLA